MALAEPSARTRERRGSIRARLVPVLRNAPSMMWLTDAAGTTIYVNRKWLTFTGRRLKDELDNGWLSSVHADDRRLVTERCRDSLRHHHPFSVEYRLRRADGAYRWICGYGIPLHEEFGPFAGYAGSAVDITSAREGGAGLPRWPFRGNPTRKREEEDLRTSLHPLRDFSARLEAAREEERRELARTLHDEVGQLLTGVRLEVAAAVDRFMDTPSTGSFAVVDRLQAAVGLVDLSIATIQRITTSLRPPILDHLGLLPAIKWEAAVFERRTGIRCRVSADPPGMDTREHTTVLYRILLEALTNVARHASAGTVWIRVKQRPGRLLMEVRDNGRGISDEVLTDGRTMGLLGMRERALSVGGEVRVARLRAGGTSVTAVVPIADAPAAPETPSGDA